MESKFIFKKLKFCKSAPSIQKQLSKLTALYRTKGDRAAEGGERACNSRTSCIEGEMLAVTKFKSRNDAV